jgi:aminoglycoside phosphotransferase (APT) family kinase protein
MALELRNLEAIGRSLSTYLSETWGRPIEAVDLIETSVGARRGNILFAANDPEHPDGPTRHDLVVTIYPPAGAVIFGVEAETGALRLAEEAGAPVAHVYEVCTDTSWFGEPFFVSQRIFGETLPRNILRLVAADDALGARMAAQVGRGFAAIHSVAAERCPEEMRRPLDVAPSQHSLELLREQMDELLQPSPTFELGVRWLTRNQPEPPARHTMVHGDVRTGNIIVASDGLRAMLDWEGCHTGDPHEDLGWVAVRTWRFGGDQHEIGGFGDLEPLVEAYNGAGGRFDPASYHWWKVFSTLRWGVGLSRQSVQHLNGTYRNIAMATSGRRAVELEYDLLRLLEPVL